MNNCQKVIVVNWGMVPVELGGMNSGTSCPDGIPVAHHREREEEGRRKVVAEMMMDLEPYLDLVTIQGELVEHGFEKSHLDWLGAVVAHEVVALGMKLAALHDEITEGEKI